MFSIEKLKFQFCELADVDFLFTFFFHKLMNTGTALTDFRNATWDFNILKMLFRGFFLRWNAFVNICCQLLATFFGE